MWRGAGGALIKSKGPKTAIKAPLLPSSSGMDRKAQWELEKQKDLSSTLGYLSSFSVSFKILTHRTSNPWWPFPSSPNHQNSRSCQNVTPPGAGGPWPHAWPRRSVTLVHEEPLTSPLWQANLPYIVISQTILATTTSLSPKSSYKSTPFSPCRKLPTKSTLQSSQHLLAVSTQSITKRLRVRF